MRQTRFCVKTAPMLEFLLLSRAVKAQQAVEAAADKKTKDENTRLK